MMSDKGTTNRTVKALTWRIGLSVFLILLIIAGIATGIIKPHGIGAVTDVRFQNCRYPFELRVRRFVSARCPERRLACSGFGSLCE